jgi:nitrogen fixation NifU-like protein
MNPLMRELYQETIMGHNKSPRNFGRLEPADASADGHNPLCGDRLSVDVNFDGDALAQVMFAGEGCAISKASASMMTEAVTGMAKDDARTLYEAFHKLVTREGEADEALLGKLRVFAGVGEFPARVKCAALAWRTLMAAMENEHAVSTE